ncbi:Heat shock protein 12B [Nowakowskiella sp. JEL0078]|nr:Heat shock protein 12B [Nowakowskiella sp. JEL0078]
MKSFFDPAIKDIINLIIRQLDSAGITYSNPLDALFLIGGFCSSRYLQNMVINHPKIKPRVKQMPQMSQPEGAILQGAAWFAFDKNVIPVRRAPASLGVQALRPYNFNIDDISEVANPSEKSENWKVNKKFFAFVHLGQSIPVGSVFPQKLSIRDGGHKTCISVYKSSHLEPKDTTERGCEMIGSFDIDISPWSHTCPEWNGKNFTVSIEFGDLELWVKVVPVLKPNCQLKQERLNAVQLSTAMTFRELS